jgi:hypothetical protein
MIDSQGISMSSSSIILPKKKISFGDINLSKDKKSAQQELL